MESGRIGRYIETYPTIGIETYNYPPTIWM
jgi:hypothetical protein